MIPLEQLCAFFHKDEYKDNDKDKDTERITESLTVCYIFGILMTQAFQV